MNVCKLLFLTIKLQQADTTRLNNIFADHMDLVDVCTIYIEILIMYAQFHIYLLKILKKILFMIGLIIHMYVHKVALGSLKIKVYRWHHKYLMKTLQLKIYGFFSVDDSGSLKNDFSSKLV